MRFFNTSPFSMKGNGLCQKNGTSSVMSKYSVLYVYAIIKIYSLTARLWAQLINALMRMGQRI